MGCIDMNTWYSRVDTPSRPDWVLFDLDPSPDVGFREVVQVALLIKDVLDTLGLAGFPKTSGADGFHILVPIARRYSYDRTRSSPRSSPERSRGCVEGLVDGVGEGEAARRPGRREPKRRGQDDRVRLLGSTAGGSSGLHAPPLGGGHRGSRARRVHNGGRARPGAASRRPLRRRADDPPVARRRPVPAQVRATFAGALRKLQVWPTSSKPRRA